MWNLKKKKKTEQENKQNRNRPIGIDNKPIIAKGKGAQWMMRGLGGCRGGKRNLTKWSKPH